MSARHDTVTSTPNLPVLASCPQLKSQFLGARSISNNVIGTSFVGSFVCLSYPKLGHMICAENSEMRGLLSAFVPAQPDAKHRLRLFGVVGI